MAHYSSKRPADDLGLRLVPPERHQLDHDQCPYQSHTGATQPIQCIGHDFLQCVKVDSQERYRKKYYNDKRDRGHKKRITAPRAGSAEDRIQSEHEGKADAEFPKGSQVQRQPGTLGV